MNKVNRKRKNVVAIRMNDAELADLQSKVEESGLTKQAFIICAVEGATIAPSDEIIVLKEISKTFANLERQLRGLAINVNQMAHVANAQGFVPRQDELERLSDQLGNYRKESENVWQSIRSLTAKHRPTER